MTRQKKKRLIRALIGAGLVILLALAVWLLPRFWRKDFRQELARTLNANPEFLLLNFPPAQGRLPGSVFAREGTLLPVAYTDRTDQGIAQGATFDLGWSQIGSAMAAGNFAGGPLNAVFSSSDKAHVELKATNCRVLEMTLGDIRRRLLGSTDVQDLAARGRKLIVVVRAYEGVLESRVRRSGKASAEAWAEVKAKAKAAADPANTGRDGKLVFKGESDDEVLLAWTEPVVFACEFQEATLFTSHLGTQPNEVRFEAIRAQDVPASNGTTSPSPTTASTAPAAPWGLMTIASGHYPQNIGLQQEWNAESATTFATALSAWRPSIVDHLWSQPDSPLQRSRVLERVRDFFRKARAGGAQSVVIYYVGHMLSSGSGDLLLLQGDVTPAHVRKVQTPSPPLVVPPESPLASAGNALDLHASVREIARRAEVQAHVAAATDEASSTPGFLTLDTLYGMAAQEGIPFAMIVDGCLADETFSSTMNSLGFQYDPQRPAQLFYAGSSPVVFREATQMGEILRRFGELRPFLRGSNPVVLAAKPGTFAMARENPFVSGGPLLGPLAIRAQKLAQNAALAAEPVELQSLIRDLAEFRYVGEINLEGSISWSNFDEWEKGGRVRPASANVASAGEEAPESPTSSNPIVGYHEPRLGQVRDFAYSAGNGRYLIANSDYGLWMWTVNPPSAKRIVEELPFPSLGATHDGELYFHGGQTNELRSLAEGQPLLKEGLYLGLIGLGADGKSVLIFEDDSVVEQVSTVWRCLNGKLETIGKLETTGIQSAVEWFPDNCYFTNDSNAIFRWAQGKVTEFCRGLATPHLLACDPQFLYCLSSTSKTLHRVTAEGAVQRASLADLNLERDPNMRGFSVASPGRLLIGTGERIAEVDTTALNWR